MVSGNIIQNKFLFISTECVRIGARFLKAIEFEESVSLQGGWCSDGYSLCMIVVMAIVTYYRDGTLCF